MSLSDPVAYATEGVLDRLAEISQLCSDAPDFWNVDPFERIEVRSWSVRGALDCQAKEAATPLTPFESTVGTVWRGAAVEALEQLARTQTDPVAAYRAAYAAGHPRYWPWDWIRTDGKSRSGRANAAERALVGANAIAFVSAAARAADQWPGAGYRHTGLRPQWFYPDRALRLAGRIDVVNDTADGEVLSVFMPGGWSRHLRSLIAYEAVVALLDGHRPNRMRVLFPDLGAHHTIEVRVDKALIDEGLDVVGTAVTVCANQRGMTQSPRPATPGAQCHYCPIAATCDEGRTWLNGIGRRRFGFPLTSTPTKSDSA